MTYFQKFIIPVPKNETLCDSTRSTIVHDFIDLKDALDYAEELCKRTQQEIVVFQAIRAVKPTTTIAVTEL